MEKRSFRAKVKPETIIQDKICDMLRQRGWYVMETHGNMYQCGFPDIYATHRKYGPRWIEVKVAHQYSFTDAQSEKFPQLIANGSRIWVLCEATDLEYEKLFKECNLFAYMLTKM